MFDTLTPVRLDSTTEDAGRVLRFAELTRAITLSGAHRNARRKLEAARDAASRTALLSPLMFVAACASGGSGPSGGGQGPSAVAPPPGDTTPDTQAGRPLAVDTAAGLLANVQVPAGVTPQVTAISVANGATGTVGQPLTSPLGTLTVAADGSYTFTPANNAAVTALGAGVTTTQNFTYTIQAGGTTYQPATLTITVAGVNDAPVALAPAPVTASASAPISLGIVVPTDPDINANGQPDPLTVSSIVLRQNGSVNASLASAFRILPDGQVPQQLGQAANNAPGTPLNLSNLPAVSQLDNIVFDPSNLPAGTYSFEYTVRDSGGRSVRQTVTITLTNANPALTADALAAIEDGGAVTGNLLANDSDPEGRALTVTRIAHGAESRAVAAGAATSVAGTFGTLSLNADGSYSFALDNTLGTVQALRAGQTATDSFTYTAADPNGGTATAQIAVTVTGVNDAPRFTGNQAFNIQQGRFDVARIVASDIDGQSLSYSITGGADAGSFFLDDLTGQLSFRGVTSVASPGDADRNNVYEVTVSVTDGTVTVSRSLAITVSLNGAPEPPVATDATAAITEGAAPATVSGLLVASDPNNDPLTFALPGGNTVTGVFGQLTVNPNGTFAYTLDNSDPDTNALGAGQTATDVFTYQVDDGTGQPPATAQVRITVTGANDAPAIAATRALTVNAGTTAVTAAGGGTDPDSNSSLTYAIAGTDAALFTVNAQTGALAFATPPSFSNPQDQGGDNVYNLTLTVSDGSLSASQAVSVTVVSSNRPPVFENDAEIAVNENTVAAFAAIVATDADGDPVTFSALGGADAARFQFNAATGALSFFTPPDFEAPIDANGDNVYEVTVTASDGQSSTTQNLRITVADVVEAPGNTPPVINAITASNFSTVDPNNATTFIYDELQAATNPVFLVSASDPNNDTLTFGLTGADSALFSINALGQVVFNTAPDFEAPQDAGGNNRYDLQVVVSDGTATVTSSVITVVVGDVLENTPPVAVNDSFTAIEDDRNPATTDDVSPVTGNILANDSDIDISNGVPGQSLRVSSIRAGDLSAGGATTAVAGPTTLNGQFGVLTIDGPGNASYVLNSDLDSLNTGDTRREVFTYTLVDNAGGSSQAELVYTIEGRTDLVAVDAVDDSFTRLVTRADFEASAGVDPISGIVLNQNDQPSTPSRTVEVIAVNFFNEQTGESSQWIRDFNGTLFSSFTPNIGNTSQVSYDGSRWLLDLADDGGLNYDLSRLVWNFRIEYTIGDTDDEIDGLLDSDSALTDTATVFITVTIDAGSVIPVAEANKSIATVQGLTTSAALNIAAPTDNTPLPANAITVLTLPTNGDITVGAGGRILAVGDTLSAPELTTLIWNAAGLAPGAYGSFRYSVQDADGNFSADRDSATPSVIEAQVITLIVAQREINLGNFTNGYTITPSTAGGGIGNSATNVDFGAALAVASDRARGSVEGGTDRDLVIGAPGHNNGAGALFGTDLTGATVGTGVISGGNRIVTGAAGQRLGTSVAVGPIDGFGAANNPEIIVGAPGTSSGAGAVYILSGASSGNPNGGGTGAINTSSFNGTNGAVISGVAGSGLGSSVAYLGNIGGVRSGPELFLNAPGEDSYFSFVGNAPGAPNNTDGNVAPISVAATNAGVGYVIDGGSYSGTNAIGALKNIANPTTATNGVGYSLGTANAGGFSAATYGTIGVPVSNISNTIIDALVLGNGTTNQVVVIVGAGDTATTAQPGVSGNELNAPLVLTTGNAADALGTTLALVDAYGYFSAAGAVSARPDTVNDLLIGAPGRDSTPNGTDNVGAAFLIMGGSGIFSTAGGFSLDNTATAARIVEIRNNIAGSGFGTVVADIGDYNGDSIGDFAIGAPGQNGGNGAVYVVFGKAFENSWFGDNNGQNRATLILDSSNLGTDYIRLDGTSGSRAGAAILGLDDINSDGRDDFAIGAPDGGAGANGIVHVIFGVPIAQVEDPRVAQNAAPAPQFSASVSVIDADGGVDAVLAAALGPADGPAALGPADGPAALDPAAFDGGFDKAALSYAHPIGHDIGTLHIA